MSVPNQKDEQNATTQLEDLQMRLEKLEQTEFEYKRLQRLIEAAADNDLEHLIKPIILYVHPDTYRIMDATEAALDYLGYDLSALCELTLEALEIRDKTSDSELIYIESSEKYAIYQCWYRHRQGYRLSVRVSRRFVTRDTQRLLSCTLEDLSFWQQLRNEFSRREDNNYQFRERLQLLNQINSELGQMTSVEALCRRGVELGSSQLGFDRVGIWLLDDIASKMIGTYGIDEKGQIRDERESAWTFEDTYVMRFLDGDMTPRIVYDAPLYNQESEFIGYGWHISVPLLDNDRFIGFMGADNYLNKRPMENYQPHLLTLYGATIGHLLTKQREQITNRKLSNAIAQSNSLITILGQHATIEFVNNAFEKITGYAPDEVIGQPWRDFLGESLFEHIWQFVEQDHTWQGELTQSRKDGTPCDTLVSVSSVRAGEGIVNYVVVQEDVTGLKQSRKREFAFRLEQERTQVLENFINDIGHEFRTPLAVIKTSTYLLERSQLSPFQQKYTTRIHQQTNYLGQMVADMLLIVELDGQSALIGRCIQLPQVLKNMIQSLSDVSQQSDVVLHLNLDITDACIHADEKLLHCALFELVENGIIASAAGDEIKIILQRHEDTFVIRIVDEGVGIPASELDKIFNRFYRVDKARSTRGTGLGLSIAQLIVQRHRGTITVESVEGQGSVFSVTLPVDTGLPG